MTSLIRSMRTFNIFFKKVLKPFFSNLGQLGTKLVKRLKNNEVNKHIPVLDIATNKSAPMSGIAEIRP